ncbi:peptidase M24, structural domain-containing protein [Paraphysoderma sedebokerense]|nr:peptidase M24, structural domain-containing protein [Paraphysoderma sedebokerense]
MTAENIVHQCQTPNCSKPSTLLCPTCIKLDLPKATAYFCSQDCFKKTWSTHKLLHAFSSKSQTYDPFAKNFSYTGPLRACYPLTPKRTVPRHIKRPDYADDPNGIPHSEMAVYRSTKIEVMEENDIEAIRTACKLGREVLDVAAKAIKPGITTDEIDRIVHEACIERNCYPSPLNYHNFPKSCCTSVNEVICHGIPDRYVLKDSDIINIDISVYHKGYHADLNETFFVGRSSYYTSPDSNVPSTSYKLINTTRECLKAAIEMVKPGVFYRDLGNAIEKVAKSNGFSVVKTYCGHGIHKLFHCAPNVPHYAKNKAVGVMKPGHIFTIEPMISEGTWRDVTWPDNWTATTADGKRSAQFEHTLLVTDTGCEILTKGFDRDTVMDGLVEPNWDERK